MEARIVRHRPREGAEDSYAGTLHVDLHVGLDDADDPITDTHELAKLLLTVAPARLTYQASRVELLEAELARYIIAAAPEDWSGYDPDDPADLAVIMADFHREGDPS